MGVKLRTRKNPGGTTSFFLDINHQGVRKIEFLPELRLSNRKEDRSLDKEKKMLAEQMRLDRERQLMTGATGISPIAKKTEVVAWMDKYISKYTQKDKRNMEGVRNRFAAFLKEEGKTGLIFQNLTKLLVEDFQTYLMKHGTGEGSSSYFARFKKMMKRAYGEEYLIKNFAAEVQTKHGTAKKKDALTLEEIKQLEKTPTLSEFDVKRAFMFCLVTGLRWVDCENLTWGNIKGNTMDLYQSKTKKDLTVPLVKALEFLGEPGKPDQKVFNLPSRNGANKTLKAWVKRAGITKKITWHNARHSAGTIMASQKVDILTIMYMLGHTSLKHTQRYVEASKELKQDAASKLNW
jgi:integrase/recombinase XerD